MAEPIEWQGQGSSPVGLTPFGFYDSDPKFVQDAPKVADFCAKKLGYPVMSVEVVDAGFYACFEESITEYGAQVNQFNIRENMLSVQGSPTGTSITGRNVISPGLGTMISIAAAYGTEVGVGGTVDWKRGSIPMHAGTQSYDLQETFASASEGGKRIEVYKVHYEGVPAIARYFDPYATTGLGLSNMIADFGWSGYSPAAQFVMMPVFEDMLRLQAIEFNDTVRRSAYTFQLVNNKVKIFPIPTTNCTLFFEYIVRDDKFSSGSMLSPIGTISDYSNIPYENMIYADINDVGRMWIIKYTLALAKELLGNIRSKFSAIPIPGSEITLDGTTLRTEGASERAELITQLRESLEQTGRTAQLEKQKTNSANMKAIFSNIPLPFYIL